jgi:hypothetical protein
MRKPFTSKVFKVEETVGDVRATAQRIGTAAESQATLNVALTAVAVTALLVAALLVHHTVTREAGRA